jgi:hypothetical protein
LLNLPLQHEQLALGGGFLVQQCCRFHLHLLLTLRHFAFLRARNREIRGQALCPIIRKRSLMDMVVLVLTNVLVYRSGFPRFHGNNAS